MKPRTLAVIVLTCGLGACAAANRATVPGLVPAADSARLFLPELFGTLNVSCPAFSPDGRTMFFMRETGSGYEILTSRHDGKEWSKPVRPAFASDHDDIDPFVTFDGSRVIFASRRPQPGTATPTASFQLWSAPANGAGDAVPFGPRYDANYSRWFATVTRSGTAYLTSRHKDGTTDNDVARAGLGPSGYEEPVLVAELNSDYADSNTLIAADESFIIFISDRPGGLGAGDLYVSHRTGGQWSAPRNLGPLVNTAAFENCPALSPDGKYLFFARGLRDAAGKLASRRIYFVEMASLPQR